MALDNSSQDRFEPILGGVLYPARTVLLDYDEMNYKRKVL